MPAARIVACLVAVVLALAAAAGSPAPAFAEKRVAVVIGNDAYANLPAEDQLRKAVNDARVVGDALASIGFDVVRGENLGRAAIIDKIAEATAKLGPGDVVFFFFAGHGVSLKSGNFILPADIPDITGGREARLANQSIAEADIVASLQEPGTRVAIVVLDACRNNPFSKPGVRAIGGSRGLSRAPETEGLFSLYSAGIGQTALDRLGDADANANSVFSRVLVPHLTQPGLSLDALAKIVRDEVARTADGVQHKQVPAVYNQILGGDYYLAGAPAGETVAQPARPIAPVPAAEAAPPAPLPAKAPPAARPANDDAAIVRAFETVRTLDTAEGYDAFIEQYPGTLYAKLAAQLRAKLGAAKPVAPKPVAPQPVVPHPVAPQSVAPDPGPAEAGPALDVATALAPPPAPPVDLRGQWSGTIVCRNGRNYAAELTVQTQAGRTAKGGMTWSGANTGRDTINLSADPAAGNANAYVLITANPQAYDYRLALEGPNMLRGQSTGSERCSAVFER